MLFKFLKNLEKKLTKDEFIEVLDRATTEAKGYKKHISQVEFKNLVLKHTMWVYEKKTM